LRLPAGLWSLIVPASTPAKQRQATIDHIATVYNRISHIAALRPAEIRVLRATALVHELSGAHLRRLAHRLTGRHAAEPVCAVVERFGSIWKLQDAAGAVALARRTGNLRLYLLFELAHEGAPPPMFAAVWAAGGLGRLPSLRR